jgi:hypothetical protein
MALPKEVWIQTGQTRPHQCPVCYATHDAVTLVSTELKSPIPKVGDFSVCITCGAVCIFLIDGRLRVATQAEVEELPEWVRHWQASRPSHRA